ncbi:hypothetical protein EDD85DRAFT_737354, partial [Armillaria nabsnona]
ILGLTCDNTAKNDTMVDALATHISSFPGQAHRVQCFTHVVNLVAKSLLKQFE